MKETSLILNFYQSQKQTSRINIILKSEPESNSVIYQQGEPWGDCACVMQLKILKTKAFNDEEKDV